MKKLSMLCMAVLLLLAASCKKEKKTELGDDFGFIATTEAHGGDSKTHLDGELKVIWDQDDEIQVYSSAGGDYSSKGLKFKATEVDGSKAGFNGYYGPAPQEFYQPSYMAYYPASMTTEGHPDQITLPATQTYAENSFAPGANPMVAKSNDTDLAFRNICGVLQLTLQSTSPCKVTSIAVTTKGSENLWGTGTVGLTDPNNPTLSAPLTNGGKTVTLDCSKETGGGVDISGEKVFRIVVPAGSLGSSFEVKLTDSDGKVWTKTATGAQNKIDRSKITWLPKQAVETKPDIPDGALPGLFSVSGTKQVYFSKGNLQHVKSSNTWQFAANQWETVETSGQNVGTNYESADVQTLFGWGTSGWNNGNYFYQPYCTSNSTSSPYTSSVGYGYGPTNSASYEFSLTGDYANADWGVYNAISNGGNQAGKWRTLTGGDSGEWYYLLKTRDMTNVSFRYTNKTGGITIGGTTYNGLFIYPDDYNGAEVGTEGAPATWDEIDALGVVFLPAAGYRDGTSVSNVGSNGVYWSSSYSSSRNAAALASTVAVSVRTTSATATAGSLYASCPRIEKCRKNRGRKKKENKKQESERRAFVRLSLFYRIISVGNKGNANCRK